MKRPTIADIAQRAHVSKGAVSYALNGQPGVSEATRARILAIAAELGWTPNSAARALSASRSDTVGLVLARPASTLGLEPFFMEFISGIQAELSQRGIGLLFQVVADHVEEMAVYRQWWSARRVDGVVMIDLCVEDERVAALTSIGLPAVIAGGPGGVAGLTSVWTDDSTAMTNVMEYLAALGHRRIARVGGPPEMRHTAVRTEAFEQAARRLHLESAPTVDTDFSDDVGARATRALLSSPNRPTAVIYDNDVMAVAGMAVTAEMGLSVPADVSLVAWDDSPLCRLTHPPLSAMSRDVAAYGAHAIRRLLEIVAGDAPGTYRDSTPSLAPRGTTARPGMPGPVPATADTEPAG
ncbi:MAG: LacI family transcriptional regulator [Actinomycetales bacterium]|nr:LacI family transcriptional regulator [Actinomycetales bacterium]